MSDKQYIDQTFRRSVYLERLKQSLVNEFGLTIKQIDKVISKLDVDELTPKQLDKYLADIGKVLESKLTEHSEKYKSQLVDIFGDCVDFEKESLINAYNIPAQSIAVPADIAAAAATAVAKPLPIVNAESVLIKDMLADFEKKETKRVLSAIRAGHFEGKTNQQLIQQIRGTRAKKYKDGILDISTRHAEAIVRTGVQQVANDARQEIARQNADIVKGEQIIATLDGRTSAICRSLDHRVFKVGEGRRPPFHINCRSTFILVLDEKYRGKGNIDKRASKDGLVANESYYEWLKTQSKAFQDDALGKVRADLLRDGGLSADDFARLNLNKNFEPLTLKEMKSKNPTAFEKMEKAKAERAKDNIEDKPKRKKADTKLSKPIKRLTAAKARELNNLEDDNFGTFKVKGVRFGG